MNQPVTTQKYKARTGSLLKRKKKGIARTVTNPVPLHNTCHMHYSKTDLGTRKREVGDWPTELYRDHCIIILDSSRS